MPKFVLEPVLKRLGPSEAEEADRINRKREQEAKAARDAAKANLDAREKEKNLLLAKRGRQEGRRKSGRQGTKASKPSIAGDVDTDVEIEQAQTFDTLGASDRKNLLGL